MPTTDAAPMIPTTTVEHVTTVTNLSDETEDEYRPVRVTCSCAAFSYDTKALLAGVTIRGHVAEATRPNYARAHEIVSAARRGTLTSEQCLGIAQALLFAADLADGVEKVQSRKLAMRELLKLVRGEA